MPPRWAKRRARQLLRLQPAVPAVASLAQHEARIAELFDPELAVVREPAIERLGVGLRLVEEVAIPHRRGLDRVVRRGVEEVRVAPRAFQPAPRTLGRVVGIERPRDQETGEPARRERGRCRSHDVLRDGVAGQAAVPEQIRALGRDDVRRVGDDEVELLAFDRLEEAAGSRLHVVGAVQRCVERRVGERALVHVGRDHALGVRGEQDRLDPVAGAEVEGTARLGPERSDARGRRTGDARPGHGRRALRPRPRGRTRSAVRRAGRLAPPRARRRRRATSSPAPASCACSFAPTSSSNRARATGTPSRKSRSSTASSSASPSRRRYDGNSGERARSWSPVASRSWIRCDS